VRIERLDVGCVDVATGGTQLVDPSSTSVDSGTAAAASEVSSCSWILGPRIVLGEPDAGKAARGPGVVGRRRATLVAPAEPAHVELISIGKFDDPIIRTLQHLRQRDEGPDHEPEPETPPERTPQHEPDVRADRAHGWTPLCDASGMASLALGGHVALVTGSGRGIGRAHALLLAERGAKVVVCDIGLASHAVDADADAGRDVGLAQQVADEIVAAGGEAVADTSDISTFEGAAHAVRTGADAFGKVDIVVNNAGTTGGGRIEDVTEAALNRQLAIHFLGAVGTTRAAWPYMKEQGWGRVVNTVSEAAFPGGIAGGGGGLGYGTAKAAVWAATFGMAGEGVAYGITVNAVSPGAFTRMNEGMFKDAPPALDLDPRHVARVVAWLVSDRAADVSGKVIHAAGGQHREYIMARHWDTPLMERLPAELDEG
jgi:NAD(P)-dependent dehydrogenase (short-subunit alcohol dehydrogenase family)